MSDTVKLSRLQTRLDELSYPVNRDEAAEDLQDVTVTFADGDANLGSLVDETGPDTFQSTDDLFGALQNVLPVEAVGEPGQAEGDS